MSTAERKAIIRSQPDLSIKRQCELLRIPRSSAYYRPAEPVCDADVEVMDVIDRIHVDEPFKGSRRLSVDLQLDHGLLVNRKRVQRLMRVMGITPVYPKPRTTKPGFGKHHKVFPYLLRDVIITASNDVWAADLTYIPMARGFVYLVAIMDVRSRKILSWRLSNTMDQAFCIEALEEAMDRYGKPKIFNSDQGSQFTSDRFTSILLAAGVKVSMDGRGAWRDNVFIERFWWTLKHEEVYLRAYESVWEARTRIGLFMHRYNGTRRHSSLKNQTPDVVYEQLLPAGAAERPWPANPKSVTQAVSL